jgi:hypothetical protein
LACPKTLVSRLTVCVAVDTMLARISFSGAPPTLGLVDFVGLTARVKLNEVWHRIDGKNCFLLL